MQLHSRRELLRHSGCGLGALAFAGMMAESGEARATLRDSSASPLSASQPHSPAKAKRIIHLFMNGGPSQIDTFDPKHNLHALNGQPLPDSVKDALQPTQRKRVGNIFASPFPFSRYGNSGLEISSLYPHVARHADDLCVIRSMQGEVANHSPVLLLTN
ncbi:MAG TPA: DUF1501 domain-containing protein, partial [Planctomycetes bacterium]|nr:DUF1501 domain-containing protein [Planctomycetota bacterium]